MSVFIRYVFYRIGLHRQTNALLRQYRETLNFFFICISAELQRFLESISKAFKILHHAEQI